MPNATTQGFAGIALLIVGTVLLFPGVVPGTGLLTELSLFVGAILLSAGAYLFGTDVDGRPV